MKLFDDLETTPYQRWSVVPYVMYGVKLYAVEGDNGCIHKYCDTKEDAQQYVDEMNEEQP